jgi:hypothetical protein
LNWYWEPESYVIFPATIRRSLADASWFVTLAGFVHVVSTLHSTLILPELYTVW